MLAAASITDAQVCEDQLDVVFLLDSTQWVQRSGSGVTTGWDHVKSFVRDMIDQSTVSSSHIRYGIVVYTDGVQQTIPLGQYENKNQMVQAVDRLSYVSGDVVSTAEAMRYAREQMFSSSANRRDAPDVLITIYSGRSLDATQAESQARISDNLGTTTYTISVNDRRDTGEARDITSSGGSFWRLDDTTQLSDYQSDIYQTIFCSDDPSSSTPDNYQREFCDTELDVVFVVDGSETVVTEGLVSWYDVMDFMIGIVDRFKVNTEKMNVGFVRYDEVAENRFYLNTDFTRNGVQKKINDLVHDHRGGVTNTAAGIQLALQDQFTAGRGETEMKRLAVKLLRRLTVNRATQGASASG